MLSAQRKCLGNGVNGNGLTGLGEQDNLTVHKFKNVSRPFTVTDKLPNH